MPPAGSFPPRERNQSSPGAAAPGPLERTAAVRIQIDSAPRALQALGAGELWVGACSLEVLLADPRVVSLGDDASSPREGAWWSTMVCGY